MAIPRKPGPALSLNITGAQYPEPPSVPPEVQERFHSMKQFDSELKNWWDAFTRMLSRDRDAIQTQIAINEAARAVSEANLQSLIDAINKAIAAP